MPKLYNRIGQISKEQFQEYANDCKSIACMIRKLGFASKAGGSYGVIKKYLQLYDTNTSHWTGQAWNKNAKLKDWAQYHTTGSCKKHLITERTHRCELCEQSDWRGFKIPLEVHHVDGIKTNNEYNNLQLLCPNCHALTDTWRGRNINNK